MDLPNLSTGNTGLSDYGVEVGFNSSLSVKGALTVGYDTYGLRELLHDIETGNNSQDLNDILDGFYVTGPNSSSNSYVSISGNFGLYAGAGVSIGPLSGSLTFNGGLNANVNLYLDDADPDSSNDGKIRISEINAELQEGQPVFEASGSVTAVRHARGLGGASVRFTPPTRLPLLHLPRCGMPARPATCTQLFHAGSDHYRNLSLARPIGWH